MDFCNTFYKANTFFAPKTIEKLENIYASITKTKILKKKSPRHFN